MNRIDSEQVCPMSLHGDKRGDEGRVSCRARRLCEAAETGRSPLISIAYPPGARPGTTHPTPMAWRPYENLIDGELDNRTPGKVKGWIRFFRNKMAPLQVTFDLEGDFHEDIRGAMIRLSNLTPSDRQLDGGTYMEGFSPMQHGTVGDITAGLPLGPWTEALAQSLMKSNDLFWEERGTRGNERKTRRREFAEEYRAHIAAGDLYHACGAYPYVEWFAENGRVVLELDPSQMEIVKADVPPKEKTPAELFEDEKKRDEAFRSFTGLGEDLSKE
jgi:hypothetical protein